MVSNLVENNSLISEAKIQSKCSFYVSNYIDFRVRHIFTTLSSRVFKNQGESKTVLS
jgi:hypothetical protein